MSARTRKVKNPFNSYFIHDDNISSANNVNSLAVAVIEKGFPNMPNINTNLKVPSISGITPTNMADANIDPRQRYVIVESALTVVAKYAAYDVVGTNAGTADERLPEFMKHSYRNIAEPNPLPSVEETYLFSKDLFSKELVTKVALSLAGPIDNPDPRLNLRNSLSNTLLIAAARLRIEAFANKGMMGDLHVNRQITTQPRFEAAHKLIRADELINATSKSNQAMRELLEEESKPKEKKKKGKVKPPSMKEQFLARNAAVTQQRAEERAAAAAAEAARIPDEFLNPSITTLNEEGYMIFTRIHSRLNRENQEKLMKMLSEYNHKLDIQLLLKLKRILLQYREPIVQNLNARSSIASKGGSAAKQSFQNYLNSMRKISNLISYRAGFVLSKHNCGGLFSPLLNCIEGRHVEAEHRRQLDALKASLHAQAEQIVAERNAKNRAGLKMMANHAKRSIKNMEIRKVRKSDGTVVRQYLPKNFARSAMTINEPDPTVENIYRELLSKRGLQVE